MPSINDVLKEKFNVTGNNIAETLSKIEPGSGGGSGTSPLVVMIDVTRNGSSRTYTLDKKFYEIYNALPNVVFVESDTIRDGVDPTSYIHWQRWGLNRVDFEDDWYRIYLTNYGWITSDAVTMHWFTARNPDETLTMTIAN